MASSRNGTVKKLMDKAKRNALKRKLGSDGAHRQKLMLGGRDHNTKTIWHENGTYDVEYVVVEPKVVPFRKPEDRKPVGFKRQAMTKWSKIEARNYAR
jgi:hypothetical protein